MRRIENVREMASGLVEQINGMCPIDTDMNRMKYNITRNILFYAYMQEDVMTQYERDK